MFSKKILLLVSLAIFLIFIYFSYLVAKEKFVQFDFDTTVRFQDHISKKWDLPFSMLSVFGSVEITGLIWLSLVVLTLLKKYWLTFISLGLLPAALIMEIFGKLFVLHPGPPFLFYRGVLEVNFPSHFVHTDYSYPSGHVLRTAFLVMFLSTWFFLKTTTAAKTLFIPPLFLLLALMIVSRITLGEHWTTDVIGGLLLGASFGIFTGITVPVKRPSTRQQSTI